LSTYGMFPFLSPMYSELSVVGCNLGPVHLEVLMSTVY